MPNDSAHSGETVITETPQDQLWPVNALAKKYDCHPNTLRNWIQSGKLSAVRFGPRMMRVRESDLQALLQPYENGQAGQWARHSF